MEWKSYTVHTDGGTSDFNIDIPILTDDDVDDLVDAVGSVTFSDPAMAWSVVNSVIPFNISNNIWSGSGTQQHGGNFVLPSANSINWTGSPADGLVDYEDQGSIWYIKNHLPISSAYNQYNIKGKTQELNPTIGSAEVTIKYSANTTSKDNNDNRYSASTMGDYKIFLREGNENNVIRVCAYDSRLYFLGIKEGLYPSSLYDLTITTTSYTGDYPPIGGGDYSYTYPGGADFEIDNETYRAYWVDIDMDSATAFFTYGGTTPLTIGGAFHGVYKASTPEQLIRYLYDGITDGLEIGNSDNSEGYALYNGSTYVSDFNISAEEAMVFPFALSNDTGVYNKQLVCTRTWVPPAGLNPGYWEYTFMITDNDNLMLLLNVEAGSKQDPYPESNRDSKNKHGNPKWKSDPTHEMANADNYYGNSGLISIYTPTISELISFANYIWSDTGLHLNDFKKIVNNPFDLVLGLNYIPLEAEVAGQRGVNVGNILATTTGLTMSYPTAEMYTFDFGTLQIGGHSDDSYFAFSDFSPHTRISIHLPFIGTQSLDTDIIRYDEEFNPVSWTLKYKYNIVNGCLTAYLINSNGCIAYEWSSSIASPVPVASNDYTNIMGAVASIVAGAVGGAVTGGALLGAGALGAVGGGVMSGASNMASLKPSITTTGSIGGCGSTLNASDEAYFIIEQADLSQAKQHGHYCGYPRAKSAQINDKGCRGYNQIYNARMSLSRATQTEKDTVVSILQSGYIYGNTSGAVEPLPSIPSGDNVSLILYQCKSSNIRIDKQLKHLHSYSNIVIKDATSIVNPVITLKATDANVTKGNYAYIAKFGRFYYVNDVISVSGDIWELHLTSDPLMSFQEEIVEHTVVFTRSEMNYNLYLNDSMLSVDSRTHTMFKKFPNRIGTDGTYVLILAGSP